VPEEVEPVRDGQLVVGLQSGIDGFLPFANRWGPAAFQIATSIYDPLVAWDENEQARPFLLESIEPEEDFTAWTLALREDITFHDGDDFDAEWAFVWSVQVHGVGQGSLPDVSAALPSHDGVTSLADIGKG
jgi:peptide/nickel transport system substrate-binding protein